MLFSERKYLHMSIVFLLSVSVFIFTEDSVGVYGYSCPGVLVWRPSSEIAQ